MGLQKNIQHEPVRRLALREPATTSPDTLLRFAIERMRQRKLGCIIVIDQNEKPIGIFTESMLTQLLTQKPGCIDDPIDIHMSKQIPWVRITDPIVDVLSAMEEKNTRFLCVVDDDDRLVGLTGQKGLMEYIAEHYPRQVMVQRIGGKPYTQQREGA